MHGKYNVKKRLGVNFLPDNTEFRSRSLFYIILKNINIEKIQFVGLYFIIILQWTMQKTKF